MRRSLHSIAWLLLALRLVGTSIGHAQSKQMPKSIHKLSLAEATECMEAFRQQHLTKDYCLQFELIHFPRHGEEIHCRGILLGSHNERGALLRFYLLPTEGRDSLEFLVESGPTSRLWQRLSNGEVVELKGAALFQVIGEEFIYTPFDLLMPFVYWDFSYVGPERTSGRSTQVFVMSPPLEDALEIHKYFKGSYRLSLDGCFDVLIKAQWLDPQGRELRTVKVLAVKKVQNQYVLKMIDIVDKATRCKDRFQVTKAAVNLELDPTLFDSCFLQQPFPFVQSFHFERL